MRKMANKNKIRWALYRKLNQKGLIYQRRGGYSLERLLDFIEAIYGVDLTVLIPDWRLVTALEDISIQHEIQRIQEACGVV